MSRSIIILSATGGDSSRITSSVTILYPTKRNSILYLPGETLSNAKRPSSSVKVPVPISRIWTVTDGKGLFFVFRTLPVIVAPWTNSIVASSITMAGNVLIKRLNRIFTIYRSPRLPSVDFLIIMDLFYYYIECHIDICFVAPSWTILRIVIIMA